MIVNNDKYLGFVNICASKSCIGLPVNIFLNS